MDQPMLAADALALADWRRQVAELYARVRQIAAADPAAAHALWRETREGLYRRHPSSPVAAAEREAFVARHFDYDPGLRFEAELVVEPDEGPEAAGQRLEGPGQATAEGRTNAVDRPSLSFGQALQLPVSSGSPPAFDRLGWLNLTLPDGPRRLAVYWLREYSGGLFLPFRDATNGQATYGAGRYVIDAAKGADLGGDSAAGTVVVDFNFAYQPSCAFDPAWSCPLAPPENWLDVPILAGERLR